ncbi:unnamed protein product [Amaranthus hypochondriacus]
MNTLPLIFMLISLFASINHAIEIDYCVGDSSIPRGPEGYACKNPSTLTTDDFVFTGFRGERTTNSIFRNNITLAFAKQFPAINGMGISMARLDLGVGGVIPVHSHRTSEIIVIIKGTIIAGFIDTTNTAYYKKLEVGDVMIFPQAMLHFQINVGDTPAMAIVSLNGASPAVQQTSFSLFAGNLPSKLAEQITLLSHKEVTRMRNLFQSA